jgi:lipopolysaccharide transport system permease protein
MAILDKIEPAAQMEPQQDGGAGALVMDGPRADRRIDARREKVEKLARYRDLLYMITWRDIKVKYKQSVMGFLWAVLMPMLVVLAGILVRFGMAQISGKPVALADIVTVSVKALPWSFFVASIRFATSSLVASSSLVTKIYFPREILPLSAILSQLVDFLVAAALLTVVFVVAQIGLSFFLFWVPLLIVLLLILTAAFGLFLAAANLFFRDVKYIVETVLTFAIFFTPVLYEAKLAGRWEWVLLLNPVAPILEGLNSAIVLHRSPELPWILYSAIVAIAGFFLALRSFKKMEPRFAESI